MATAQDQDMKFALQPDGTYDLAINKETADFDGVQGFETAILVSLYIDARAPSSVVIKPENRRGWLGNILTADIQRQLGSTAWTFENSRLTQATLNFAESVILEAFNWFTEDRYARTVSVDVSKVSNGIKIDINIRYTDDTVERWRTLWIRTKDF